MVLGVAGVVCHTRSGKQTLGKVEIVRISGVCVVLHNMIIWYISEGLVEDYPYVYFLTELYEGDDSNDGQQETDLGA